MTTINMLMSIIFISTKHPIPMILSLITFTITSSILTSSLINNAWFGYSLTLIMIGGMMMIFIYMTATLPNTKMLYSSTTTLIMISLWIMIPPTNMTSELQTLSNNMILEFFTSYSTIMLATYLLITLTIINKASTHLENNMRAAN